MVGTNFGIAAALLSAFVSSVSRQATAQQTLVVGTGGTFATIASAIAAAAPGDTVLVQGGFWVEMLDVDKGIHLVGRGARLGLGLLFPQSVAVHDVPAGQVFTMSGFVADGSFDLLVTITDCDGIVALRELGSNTLRRWSVRGTDSAQIAVEACDLRVASFDRCAAELAGSVVDPVSVNGLSLTSSRVAVVACTVHDGGLFNFPPIWQIGGELALTRSTVYAVSASAPAILATDATILVDPSTTLTPSGGQPAVAGTFGLATFEFASLTAGTDGQTLTMDAHGTAGAPFLTLLSLPAPETPSPYGFAWIDSVQWIVVDAAAYPPGRLRTASFAHPALPAGFTVALQTVWLSPTGAVLGTPCLVTVP